MSEETKKKLLELIEEYRAKAGKLGSGSALQAMHTAYADGISRAITEIGKEATYDAE